MNLQRSGLRNLAVLVRVVAVVVGFTGCVLPKYDKVDAKPSTSASCGLSGSKLASACQRCIQKNCCGLADSCGAGTQCGDDLKKAITPYAEFSDEFTPLLGCMQSKCDDACGVSWGCLGNYSVPVPKAAYEIPIEVIDFAAQPLMPLPDVKVDACNSIDSACESGRATSEVSDEQGTVKLQIESPSFNGYFEFSGGGYVSATAQFTEPLYRTAGFQQPLLMDGAIQAIAIATGVHKSGSEMFDPTHGHLIFRAQNCLPPAYLRRAEAPHAEAAGVTVDIEPNDNDNPIFYTDDSANVSPAQKTVSLDGYGGAFDFPPINLTVTATDESGREVSSGVVVMREKTVGFIYLLPKAGR